MLDFFFDIDGTLLPFGKPAPDSAVEAIAMLKEMGHRVFLATGRSPVEVPEYVYSLGFRDGVFSAGACIIADGRCVFSSAFTPEQRADVLSYCRSEGFRLLVQTAAGTYASAEDYDFWLDRMRRFAGSELQLSSMVITPELPEDAVIRKVLYVTEHKELEDVREALKGRFDVVDNTVGLPSDMMGEIVLPSITKASGIDRIIEHYGDDISRTVAIGDGANDIEMVEHAGLGIAMGNADECLKEAAAWIAPPIMEDGLAAAIRYALNLMEN